VGGLGILPGLFAKRRATRIAARACPVYPELCRGARLPPPWRTGGSGAEGAPATHSGNVRVGRNLSRPCRDASGLRVVLAPLLAVLTWGPRIAGPSSSRGEEGIEQAGSPCCVKSPQECRRLRPNPSAASDTAHRAGILPQPSWNRQSSLGQKYWLPPGCKGSQPQSTSLRSNASHW